MTSAKVDVYCNVSHTPKKKPRREAGLRWQRSRQLFLGLVFLVGVLHRALLILGLLLGALVGLLLFLFLVFLRRFFFGRGFLLGGLLLVFLLRLRLLFLLHRLGIFLGLGRRGRSGRCGAWNRLGLDLGWGGRRGGFACRHCGARRGRSRRCRCLCIRPSFRLRWRGYRRGWS